MWPPSSPDLHTIDLWAWSAIKARTNRRAYTTKTSLIATIKENFAILDRDMVTSVWGRVEAVIEAGGDFIE